MATPNSRFWAQPLPETRHEALFGDRVVKCFAKRPGNFDQLIREVASKHAERPAFVYGGTRLDYRSYDESLSRVAANLAMAGIEKGDRVGVFCDNSIAFMQAVFGIVRSGAVAVPLGIRHQMPELEYVINDCGMKAVVFDANLGDRLPPPDKTGTLEHRYCVGGAAGQARPFEDLLLPASSPFVAPAIEGEDLAMVMYTSGTTGKPKGAMLPHLAFVHSAMHFENCLGHDFNSKALLTIPASHISGLGAIVISMMRAGGCTVITNGFNPGAFLKLMAEERCTFTVLVPAMYKLCLLEPEFDKRDLSAWKIGLFGGAIMPPATIDALAGKLPRLALVNGYGATETTSPAAVMPLGHTAGQTDSVGQTVPCGDIRVMNEFGHEVAPGEAGELWIRGPMNAQGYWNNPDATQENFTAGYWHSGDIGSVDAKGYVRVLDRKKDMINRGGYKVYSAEVENELVKHPKIVEAVIVGSPDSVLGERVYAFICARSAGLTGEDIRAFCKPLMADYKIPELFTIGIEPLPRNANGKFEKALLRQKASEPGAEARRLDRNRFGKAQ